MKLPNRLFWMFEYRDNTFCAKLCVRTGNDSDALVFGIFGPSKKEVIRACSAGLKRELGALQVSLSKATFTELSSTTKESNNE